MISSSAATLSYLQQRDLTALFTEELGWEHHRSALTLTVAQQVYRLQGIAEKRGLVIYTCESDREGRIPPAHLRRAIEQRVADVVREHIIIFLNAEQTETVWQWVRRNPGQPSVPREETYN